MIKKFLPSQTLKPWFLSVANEWKGKGREFSFEWNKKFFWLELLEPQTSFVPSLTIAFEWNDAPLVIGVRSLPSLDFFENELMGVQLEDLEKELQHIVLEAILQKIQSLLQKAFKGKFILRNFFLKDENLKNPETSLTLSLGLKNESGQGFHFFLENPEMHGMKLIESLLSISPSYDEGSLFETIPLPFRLELNATYLNGQLLKTCRPGDVLLFDQSTCLKEANIKLTYLDFFFAAKVENNYICLTTPMDKDTELPVGIIPDEEESPAASDEFNNAVEPEMSASSENDLEEDSKTYVKGQTETQTKHSSAADLNTLPVRVTFDLGEKIFTFKELREINEGYTFELNRSLEENVRIRANGKLIGEGELVTINDRLGVRITHFV